MTNYGVHKYKKLISARLQPIDNLSVSTLLRCFVYDSLPYGTNFHGTLRIHNGVLYSFGNPIAKQLGEEGFVVARWDSLPKSKTHLDQLCTLIYTSNKNMEVVPMSEIENA